MGMIELKLLGRVEVQDGNSGIDLASAKLAGLLAVLAAAGGKPVPRETLTDLLWGSRFDEQARQNFRQALTRLRKLLGVAAIVSDDQAIRLDPSQVAVDLTRFAALQRNGIAADLRAATELVRGEFLEGLVIREAGFADWLAAERRRLGSELREIHLKLATTALEGGDAAAALGYAEAMTRHDPLDEEGHRLQLRALAALGRKHEALKVHQAFVAHLKAELGTAPDSATTELVAGLKDPATPGAAAPAPDTARVSIAVMPLANLSPDPEQTYFADGMAEELITVLSRLPWLKVISRSGSFAFRDSRIDARQAGRELGVRYVLEGTVRKSDSQVRISGQLIDTATGLAIWGEHFDGELRNIFELQDRVAAKVVGSIQPKLEQAELERSRRKPTVSLDAYDYYLRGLSELHRWTRDGNREALQHFYRAIELDPRFGAAYGMAARCLSQRKTSEWVEDEAGERAEAERLAKLAVDFGRDDPVALSAAGIATAFVVGRVREGGDLIERSLAINPGYAVAWMYRSWIKTWIGEADEALASIDRALDISPHNPDPYVRNLRRLVALTLFVGGRYEEAIAVTRAFTVASPNATSAAVAAAASAALLGRLEEARASMAELRLIAPKLCLANLRKRLPFVRDEDYARLAEGLRLAGLPE
jgi:TolB-like protein/DNA-binding SARP family transcriptional activator